LVVRLASCVVERNGGDGLLVRDGAAVVLSGGCVVERNAGAGLRWFVAAEREAEAALALATGDGGGGDGTTPLLLLLGPGSRVARNGKGQVVVDTGGGAGDPRAADALAAFLARGGGGGAEVTLL
jgi:hypothetical protein